jgi:hypothetical protein
VIRLAQSTDSSAAVVTALFVFAFRFAGRRQILFDFVFSDHVLEQSVGLWKRLADSGVATSRTGFFDGPDPAMLLGYFTKQNRIVATVGQTTGFLAGKFTDFQCFWNPFSRIFAIT